MALRCELLHDPERGPGHGLLKVAPLTPAPAVVRFSLMRNQGGDRYLGPEGRWQATVYEHDANAEASEGGVSVALGAWFVDAIVEQSPAVLYQLCVTVAAGKQAGSLRVDRQRLLGSKAESRTPRQPPAPVQERAGEPEPSQSPRGARALRRRGRAGSRRGAGTAAATAPIQAAARDPLGPRPCGRGPGGGGCGGIATSRGSRRDTARPTV